MHYSVFEYNAEVKPLGKLTLYILEKLYLVKIERNNNNPVSCNNLTLINLILLHFGPMKEPTVAKFIILIQSLSSVFGLFVLYPLLSSILRTANLSKWLTPTDFYNENM